MNYNQNVASNLVHGRRLREMSLADLATAAGISKSTLHDIERGAANPRLDTLYAIASALDLNLGDLIAEPVRGLQVTRADEGPVATGVSVDARLMHRISPSGDVEVYDISLGPEVQLSNPHRRGTSECLIVHSGTVEAGPTGDTAVLEIGDSVWFATDREHSYRSITPTATATLIVANAGSERAGVGRGFAREPTGSGPD